MNTLIKRTSTGKIEINTDALKLENYSPEEQIKYLNRAMERILTTEGEKVIKASAVDLDEQVRMWLKNNRSEHTKNVYRRGLEQFFSYLEGIGIHPLTVSAETADGYVVYLGDHYSAGGVRTRVSACSSFYSRMYRYGHIERNPFRGVKLPKKIYKKATGGVMSDEELQEIIKRLQERMGSMGNTVGEVKRRKGAMRLYLAIHFMSTYGLRAGAVETIRLGEESFTYQTKGGKTGKKDFLEVSKKMPLNWFDEKPLEGYHKKAMQEALRRLTGELYGEGKLREKYSCHDFRHYFSHKHYREHKDIVRLKEMLDHASIQVTDVYLQGIGAK